MRNISDTVDAVEAPATESRERLISGSPGSNGLRRLGSSPVA
jgi:hypothetical protein